MKLTKKRKAVVAKVDKKKQYSIQEAAALMPQINCTKFDSSVDLHIHLGVDPTKADQALRGTVLLPNGIGKTKKVLVLCTADKNQEAEKANADFVGLDEYLQKIEAGWTDVDVIIATPSVMPKLGKLGKILGPRNLMPNPKTGTVTNDIATAVKEVKLGKIAFRVDKSGIIHSTIGRVSFSVEKLEQNALELINTIIKMKPSTVRGAYIKSIFMATTMSDSVPVEIRSFI